MFFLLGTSCCPEIPGLMTPSTQDICERWNCAIVQTVPPPLFPFLHLKCILSQYLGRPICLLSSLDQGRRRRCHKVELGVVLSKGFCEYYSKVTSFYQKPELTKSLSVPRTADVRGSRAVSTCRSLLRSLNTIEKLQACSREFPLGRTLDAESE